jgi:hypothetical protein
MNAYEVIEFLYNDGEDVTVVATFTTEAEAQAFAVRHYETQISTTDDLADVCACETCTEGWRVVANVWKSLCVEVREAN